MSQDGKTTPSVASVVGIVALLFAGMFVLFGSAQRFDNAVVENKLKTFAAYASRAAQKYGKSANFKYGDISIVGWGYDKRAIVRNVSLEISEAGLFDTNRWVVSTEAMTLRPDHVMADRVIADFDAPVNIIRNSTHLYTMRFSDALHYAHYDGLHEGQRMIDDSIALPEKIVVTPIADGSSATPAADIEITYNPNHQLHLREWPEKQVLEVGVGLENLRIMKADEPLFVVGAFSSYVNEELDTEQRLKGQFTITAIDFFMKDDRSQRKPYSFNMDIGYTTDSQQATHLTFNKYALMNNDFKFKVTGGLTIAQDDRLPYGKLMLELSNPTQFLNSNLIPESSRNAVRDVLAKVSGNLEQPTISIPISREKNQSSYFGSVTFEEIAAMLFTGLIQSPPATKTLPPEQGTADEQ